MEQANPEPNSSPGLWHQLIDDMKSRDEVGLKRYGTHLQANNGRDALRDFDDELSDSLIYSRQLRIELQQVYEQLVSCRTFLKDYCSEDSSGYNLDDLDFILEKILTSNPMKHYKE